MKAGAKRGSGTTYLLRDVPDQIWRGARSRAVLEGRPIRSVIVRFLECYGRTTPKIRRWKEPQA